MNIINKATYFTDNQLERIIELTKLNCKPDNLIICENRSDVLKSFKNINLIRYLAHFFDLFIWLGKVEGLCHPHFNSVIMIFVYSQNDDGDDILSKQLYSLHALSHELRHLWQIKNEFKGNREDDADGFATKFVNSKSKKIAKIMGWEDEWGIEEED